MTSAEGDGLPERLADTVEQDRREHRAAQLAQLDRELRTAQLIAEALARRAVPRRAGCPGR